MIVTSTGPEKYFVIPMLVLLWCAVFAHDYRREENVKWQSGNDWKKHAMVWCAKEKKEQSRLRFFLSAAF
jgi:hypothetical protein